MARSDYVMPSGKWVSVPSAEMIARLDRKISEGINADEGGTWAPMQPIAIGGAGLHISGGARFLGGVRTGRGYAPHIEGSLPRISLSGTKVPRFSTPRSRVITVSLAPLPDRPRGKPAVKYDRAGNLIVTMAKLGEPGYGEGLEHRVLPPQMRFHDGSTLARAVFRWRLTEKPPALPPTGVPITFGIHAYRSNLADYPTGHRLSLHTNGISGGALYGGGFASPIYSTLEELWNSGGVQTLTFETNQNNVIDGHAFVYEVYIGFAYSALIHSVELHLENIQDQRWE
jgi:hypothetical protein